MTLIKKLGLSAEPVYLVDGTAYIYRAFYAYPDLKRRDGFPTSALFIVLKLLFRLIREEHPKYLCFFLDGRGPNFRHELYEPYKAQRTAAPEPLIAQIDPIIQGVGSLGFRVEVSEGCEADDLIASYAASFGRDRPVVIIGADKDLRQCLSERVFMWDPAAKKDVIHSLASFRDATGLEPSQWPDFQAIIGDSSDNIPGAPGVGPKTAEKIFAQFDSLEQLRDGMDKLTPSLHKKLAPHIDDLFLYRRLTRLKTDLASEPDLKKFSRRKMDFKAVSEFIKQYELKSLARELPDIAPSGQAVEAAQLPLFMTPKSAPEKIQITELDSLDGLPDLSGESCSLVPAESGLLMAVKDREYLFKGAPGGLIDNLARAKLIHTPSLKTLFQADPGFSRIPLDQWFDLALAAYLLHPEDRDYSLERLISRRQADLELNPANKGLCALAIGKDLRDKIENADLGRLMRELEIPLIPVLAEMERNGVMIDLEAFSAFLEEVSANLDRLTARIQREAGGPFNIRSSQQLSDLLFKTLGLKPVGKTPGGVYSTSQQVLEKLRGKHPVIEAILEYRKLEKLRSTYLEPLPKLVDESGRIHTTFNQLATATGRLSSSNPNLQNIPIRGEMGKRMRSCFTAGPEKLLAAADYSQIELRVLAHMSKDPTLTKAFNENQDIHASTACLLYDKPVKEITPDERRNAKTINFGLIYGMGPQKLARELKITLNQAKEFIERYFDKLKILKNFYEEVVEGAKTLGYVVTLAGRRRLLPDIHSRNAQLQSQARRQAVNTLIQGSAADIIKIAMLKTYADQDLQSHSARLILQVHDELVLEAPRETASLAGQRLSEIMTGAASLDVPLAVDWGVGQTWAEAH